MGEIGLSLSGPYFLVACRTAAQRLVPSRGKNLAAKYPKKLARLARA